MSSSGGANQNGAPRETTNVPELDIVKLHALPTEQQDLFLLTFVTELRKCVEQIPPDALPPVQSLIKKEVVKIVGLGSPSPSRVIRNTLGKILASAFGRGGRSLLYETVHELLNFVNTGKTEKEVGPRHAAIVCLGELFKAAGDSAVSLAALIVQSLLKFAKSAHVGLRASIFKSIGQLVHGLQTSLDEHIARDSWKAARSAATSDKSALVQKHAFLCLHSLVNGTTYFNNSNDFESLKSTTWKALDSHVSAVRYTVATTLGATLVQAYSENNAGDIPVIRKTKKPSKKQGLKDEDEEENERPGSPTPGLVKLTTQMSLTLPEILRTLSSHYVKTSTTNRARSGIARCYQYLLKNLPTKVVEDNFSTVSNHLFTDLLNSPGMLYNRYRLLLTRNLVQAILKSGLTSGLLTENAQINLARFLVNDILKNYPKTVSERREPAKLVLIGALETLTTLITQLGSAATLFQDSCREGLCQVIQHPSFTVQCHVAQCFRAFVLACPGQLVRCVEHLLTQLKKGLDPNSDNRHNARRYTGHATCIASILRSAYERPLFGSVELYSQIFTYATDLLKLSAAAELRLSATQVQVAWTLIGGLMNLGPSFVKIHLNQLFLLWRNALPLPLTRENTAQRAHLELSFLAHVRECALTGLLTFLDGCSSLVTTDGARRLSTMLQSSAQFLESLPNARQTEDVSLRLVPAIQLQDMALMLRRRLLQCFSALAGLKNIDQNDVLSQSDLVSLTMKSFTSPDRPSSKNVEASLASSASTFEGLWEAADNWGYGVTSLSQGRDIYLPQDNTFLRSQDLIATVEAHDAAYDDMAYCPSLPALEHDPATLYRPGALAYTVELSSAATACINASIKLFAIVLSQHSARIQESSLEHLNSVLSQSFQREPGRKAALQMNVSLALVSALAVANNETTFTSGKLHLQSFRKTLAEMLQSFLADSDTVVRNLGARSLGILCNLAGTQATNNEVKLLVDKIVADRDPYVRAGCALALGYVHLEVGAMAASLHLKSIVGVLLSLCSDTHPVVHFWALRGLMMVGESAGLSFTTYATSTLGLLAQLYLSDSHNSDSGSLSTSNLELEYSTPLVVAQCVDCIINVLGPDLQDISKPRNLILTFIAQLQDEDAPALRYQSLVCLGHVSMYAPAHLQFAKYVQDLQVNLSETNTPLLGISVSGLGDLMKRSAAEVFRVSSNKLNDELWTKLDEDPTNQTLQTMLRNWMQQTAMTEPAEWVERCQLILSKTRIRTEVTAKSAVQKSVMPDLADEEVAGFAAAAAAAQGDVAESAVEGQEFLRWQTRDFAMCLLSELLQIVQSATSPDQILPAEEVLQNKVGEIIRIAFSASTATVVELRIWGLRLIDQILRMFGRTPDPDFLEASLLEQYQAQISSALTPAFSADSSPELAAEAIAVCATFVATGIVTSAERMGRIFKVLSAGLNNLVQEQREAAIGDLRALSPNAQSMLKMAILSGWAQLQLASSEQAYLEEIVLPFVPKLAPLWLAALQEFAGLRFEPEISDSLGGDTFTSNLDERYASFHRLVRLPYYQHSWLNIVNAVAALVEKDSEAVFDALDMKQASSATGVNGQVAQGKDMSFREEPVAFFFILFGLAFEALVTRGREDPSQALSILHALKKILTPAVSGISVYDNAVFNETTDTLDRLAMTSTTKTQSALIEIARNLSLDHPSAKSQQGRDDKLSDDIEQLFELTRIIILVLTGLIPTLEDPPGSAYRKLLDESVALVQLSFKALVDVAEVFPAIIRADLHACILHCFCTMLATGICQDEVVPALMPVFRDFLQGIMRFRPDETTQRSIRGSLHQMLKVMTFAQRRENEFALTCAKNTLLSMTILLSSAGTALGANDELILRVVSETLDCLQDVGLAKVATNCLRTLLLSKPKSPCSESIARLLWPKLLLFITDPSAEDPEAVKPVLVQVLVTSIAALAAEARQSAMSILIPLLLNRASQPTPNGSQVDTSKDNAAKLLELALADPAAFRSTVSLLDEAPRANLGALLQSAGIGKRQEVDEEEDSDSQPAIALRTDF